LARANFVAIGASLAPSDSHALEVHQCHIRALWQPCGGGFPPHTRRHRGSVPAISTARPLRRNAAPQ
jgi:hypothetical protein